MTSNFGWKHLLRFVHDDRGAVTVESVLWLPVFFAFLALAADGSVMFTKRAMALRVVQDGNRGYVVGRFTSTDQTQNWVLNNLASISPNATAFTWEASDVVATRVEMPASDLDAVGLFGLLSGFNVAIQAEQLLQD